MDAFLSRQYGDDAFDWSYIRQQYSEQIQGLMRACGHAQEVIARYYQAIRTDDFMTRKWCGKKLEEIDGFLQAQQGIARFFVDYYFLEYKLYTATTRNLERVLAANVKTIHNIEEMILFIHSFIARKSEERTIGIC